MRTIGQLADYAKDPEIFKTIIIGADHQYSTMKDSEEGRRDTLIKRRLHV